MYFPNVEALEYNVLYVYCIKLSIVNLNSLTTSCTLFFCLLISLQYCSILLIFPITQLYINNCHRLTPIYSLNTCYYNLFNVYYTT